MDFKEAAKEKAGNAAPYIFALAGAFAVNQMIKYGVDFDANIPVPFLEYIEGAPEFLKNGIDTARDLSVPIAAGTIGAYASFVASSKFSPKAKARLDLAESNYSTNREVNPGVIKNRNNPLKKGVAKAAILASLVPLGAATASAIEREVSDGPSRPILSVAERLTIAKEISGEEAKLDDLVFVAQNEEAMFMNDSFVNFEVVARIGQELDVSEDEVVPFDIQFVSFSEKSKAKDNSSEAGSLGDIVDISNRWGLALALPSDERDLELDLSKIDCKEAEIGADRATSAEVGDEVYISGKEFTVGYTEEGLSSMNRAASVFDLDEFEKCMQNADSMINTQVWGLAIQGHSIEEVDEALSAIRNDYPDIAIAALDIDQLLDNNQNFWSGNGTPLVIILLSIIAGSGAANVASKRRDVLHENKSQIANLRVNGVPISEIKYAEVIKATGDAVKALPIAALMTYGASIAINTTVVGIEVAPNPKDLTLAMAIVSLSSIFSSVRTTDNFSKKLNLSKALKQ